LLQTAPLLKIESRSEFSEIFPPNFAIYFIFMLLHNVERQRRLAKRKKKTIFCVKKFWEGQENVPSGLVTCKNK